MLRRIWYTARMAQILTTEELKKKIDNRSDDFYLIDVLPLESYAARRIPGALNIPKGADFVERFESQTELPKDTEIIVYCSSNTCTASVQSAEQLEKAGYTNVWHYKDGLAGWKNAGYEFESDI